MKGTQICNFYPEARADFVAQIHELILLCCLHGAGFSCHLRYLQEETLPFSPLLYPPLSFSTLLQIIKLYGRNSFEFWQVLTHKKPFLVYIRVSPLPR